MDNSFECKSNYGAEISIARDRIVNHGGYDYGNVLYGDRHIEAKEITGGAPVAVSIGTCLSY